MIKSQFYLLVLINFTYCLIPKPFSIKSGISNFRLIKNVKITQNQNNCDLLDRAIDRFYIRLDSPLYPIENSTSDLPFLDVLRIDVASICNESSKKLWPVINSIYDCVHVSSPEVWGAIYALETIYQLLYIGSNGDGAFCPSYIYFPADVTSILEYARLRGIRVIPEIDSPGHTLSFGKSHTELLTECYVDGKVTSYGPFNPVRLSTYSFMSNLLSELVGVFKDKLFHLGGDEVDPWCWSSNNETKNYNPNKLQSLYTGEIIRRLGIASSSHRTPVLWQDVFDNGFRSPHDDLIFQVWRPHWHGTAKAITQRGYPILISSCWYLDVISYGQDWKKYYACDPQQFDGSEDQKALVIGGEAAIWGEYVDETNLYSRSWPRGFPVAERLWSPKEQNASEFKQRMHELRCRLVRMDLPASPVYGPSFCPPVLDK